MGNIQDCESCDEGRYPTRLPEVRYYSAWDNADITHRTIIRTAEQEVSTPPRKKRKIDVTREFEIALLWAYSDEAVYNCLLEERTESRCKPLHLYETATQKAALEVYRRDEEVRNKIRRKCMAIAIKREELRRSNDREQHVYHRLPEGKNKKVYELEKVLTIKKQMLLEFRKAEDEKVIRWQRGGKKGYTYASLLELYEYGGEGFGSQRHHLRCYDCREMIPVWRKCHICKHLNKKHEGRNIFELSLGCHSEKHQRALLRELCYNCRVTRQEDESDDDDSSSEEE